jgi:hypothetical protein
MEKFTARVKVKKNIYIHNDIDQAAFNFKQRIEARAAKGDRAGIGGDIMACLILLAFANEAKFNFLGYKLIENWDERMPIFVKVKKVLKHLGLRFEKGKRPYKAIADLKAFRDTLAHGKPVEVSFEGDITATKQELLEQGKLAADYEKFLKEALLYEAYDDLEAIWKDLLKRSSLNIMDTITQGGVEYRIIASNDAES